MANFPGQMDPKQRLQLMKKLHRQHVHTPGFGHPVPVLPQPGNPQLLAPVANPAANNALRPQADPGNPYGSIVSRNVFGLNPPPPQNPQDEQQGPPPQKITLTGIMTIFGPPEALFNVAGVVRGDQPPHDESYIFTEGEEQDEVEVTSIDTNKNVVTFNNHGTTQTIALVDGTASSGSAPAAPTWPSGFRPRRFGRNFGGGPGNFPPPFQPQSFNNGFNGNGNSGANNQPASFGNYNNAPGNVHNYTGVSPAVSALSDEDQQALIAAQAAIMRKNGDPSASIMPPSDFDGPAQDEANNEGNGPK